MQYRKALCYRASLIQRGEVETVTVERHAFSLVWAAFLLITINILYSSVADPVITAWTRLSQVLLKAGT